MKNEKDITNIQRHFTKMFAIISALKLPNGNVLEECFSRRWICKLLKQASNVS